MDPGIFKLLIGSKYVSDKKLLVKYYNKNTVMTHSESDSEEGGGTFLNKLFKSTNNGNIYM